MPISYRLSRKIAQALSIVFKLLMKSERGFEFAGGIHDNLHRVPHISIRWIYQGVWREKLLNPIHELINLPHYVAQDLEDELFLLFVDQAHLEDEIPGENYVSDLPEDDSTDYRGWGDVELCAYCRHPFEDHLNSGIQEPCRHSGCTCPTFVSEEYMSWQQYCKSLDEIETKRQ